MLRQTISGLGCPNFQICEEICLFNQWPRSHITGVSRMTCNARYYSSMMCWDPMRYTRLHLARFRARSVVGCWRYLLDFPLFSSLRAEHGPGECRMSAIYGGLHGSMCGHGVWIWCKVFHIIESDACHCVVIFLFITDICLLSWRTLLKLHLASWPFCMPDNMTNEISYHLQVALPYFGCACPCPA